MPFTNIVSDAAGAIRTHEYHGEIFSITDEHHFAKRSYTTSGGTVVAAVPGSLSILEPHARNPTANTIVTYDAAIITSAEIEIIPGPRSIDKFFTITCVWTCSDWGSVETLADMARMPHAKRFTFGGGPGLDRPTVVPLDLSTTPVLKSRITTARPAFVMAVEAHSITGGPTVAAGSFFDIHFRMRYTTHGGF